MILTSSLGLHSPELWFALNDGDGASIRLRARVHDGLGFHQLWEGLRHLVKEVLRVVEHVGSAEAARARWLEDFPAGSAHDVFDCVEVDRTRGRARGGWREFD